MKAPKVTEPIRDTARAQLDAWVRQGKTMEDMASLVGCSLRSIQKWLDGKQMTRLSAKAIIAAGAS